MCKLFKKKTKHSLCSKCGTVVTTVPFSPGHIYSNSTTSAFKMAAAVIETCHVACCANRTPNVVSWGRGGTIAYGTCNSVALYDPEVGQAVTFY